MNSGMLDEEQFLSDQSGLASGSSDIPENKATRESNMMLIKCCSSASVNQRRPQKPRSVTPKSKLAVMSCDERKTLSRVNNKRCQREYYHRKKEEKKNLKIEMDSLEAGKDDLQKKTDSLNKKVAVLNLASERTADVIFDQIIDSATSQSNLFK